MDDARDMHGLRMDYVWIMHGLCMEYQWIMHGILMGYAWIMHGIWITQGPSQIHHGWMDGCLDGGLNGPNASQGHPRSIRGWVVLVGRASGTNKY